MLLQKTFTEDFLTKKKVRNRGERRKYLVEESHNPIISAEQFQQVQSELLRRSDLYKCKHRGDVYPFTGLIRCGHCGASFCRKNAPTSNHRRLIVWMCNTFNEMGKNYCSAQRIREEILFDATRRVLGLSSDIELTRENVLEAIEKIEVPTHNILRFYLKDGRIETAEWKNPSRSKSWTPEMRERARQKSLEQHRKRKGEEE